MHTIEAVLIYTLGLYKLPEKHDIRPFVTKHGARMPIHRLGDINASLPLEYISIVYKPIDGQVNGLNIQFEGGGGVGGRGTC